MSRVCSVIERNREKKWHLFLAGQLDDLRKWVIENKAQEFKVIMYHKPLGQICTRKDEKNRPTVFDNLPELKGQRWINIGRLDINTTGLLMFTTDGNFANHMMHPSTNIDREYACRIYGEVDQIKLDNLRNGVELEDGKTKYIIMPQDGMVVDLLLGQVN